MNKIINSIKSYFTLEFHYKAFYDSIGGKQVNMYVDCFGDLYLKDGRWSLFKIHKGNVYLDK